MRTINDGRASFFFYVKNICPKIINFRGINFRDFEQIRES